MAAGWSKGARAPEVGCYSRARLWRGGGRRGEGSGHVQGDGAPWARVRARRGLRGLLGAIQLGAAASQGRRTGWQGGHGGRRQRRGQ